MTRPQGPSDTWKNPPRSWLESLDPHRVVGHLYAVGTRDLGVFLVTTDEGHILINTGLQESTGLIRRNVEALGFRLEDTRILLTSQAHWDHTASLAEIKSITGAKIWATKADAPILADGGYSDPQFGGVETFEPVQVDELITHQDTIELGGTRLTVHEHPGHTQGSASYTMEAIEGARSYDVVIANMGTINPGKRLVHDQTYPGVADDFAETFRRQKAMDTDIWVAAHANHYRLHDKLQAGEPDSAETFVDPKGFADAVNRLERIFLDEMDRQSSLT